MFLFALMINFPPKKQPGKSQTKENTTFLFTSLKLTFKLNYTTLMISELWRKVQLLFSKDIQIKKLTSDVLLFHFT